MPARVLAIVFASMLMWSSMATHASSLSLGAMDMAQAHALAPAVMDDNCQDGQPAPSQAEAAADLEALVVQDVQPRGPAAAAARPWPWSAAGLPAPFLDGLQRPPEALRAIS